MLSVCLGHLYLGEWMSLVHRVSYQVGGSNFLRVSDKKVVEDFVHNNLISRFGVPKSIITDNGANLNIH